MAVISTLYYSAWNIMSISQSYLLFVFIIFVIIIFALDL